MLPNEGYKAMPDFLIRRDFNGRRSESVLFVDEENEIEPYRNENVPGDNAGERHSRPPKTVVERRDDKKSNEAD